MTYFRPWVFVLGVTGPLVGLAWIGWRAWSYAAFGTPLPTDPMEFGFGAIGLLFALREGWIWATTPPNTYWADFYRRLGFLRSEQSRSEDWMAWLQTQPDWKDFMQTMAQFPDQLLVHDPASEGEWRIAHAAYLDANNRQIDPRKRREDRAVVFRVYLQTRFKPYVQSLEKNLRDGSWRWTYPTPSAWRAEVPQFKWFPEE